jgi:hypothetical protein
MASKKPAKPIAGQNRDKGPTLPGKVVYYFGGNGCPPFVCPTCGSTFKKAFVYEENNVMYCKRICIPKPVEATS